jgi:hypothetical protein
MVELVTAAACGRAFRPGTAAAWQPCRSPARRAGRLSPGSR